jgi:hypothetical protein
MGGCVVSDPLHGPSDSGDTVTISRELAKHIDRALTNSATTLIAVLGDDPYPDDPRWTPWTRFGSPVCARISEVRKGLREALRA